MEWIKCSDRLPEEFIPKSMDYNQIVLVTWGIENGGQNPLCRVASWESKRIRLDPDPTKDGVFDFGPGFSCFFMGTPLKEITHWMPMPEPPTQEIKHEPTQRDRPVPFS